MLYSARIHIFPQQIEWFFEKVNSLNLVLRIIILFQKLAALYLSQFDLNFANNVSFYVDYTIWNK